MQSIRLVHRRVTPFRGGGVVLSTFDGRLGGTSSSTNPISQGSQSFQRFQNGALNPLQVSFRFKSTATSTTRSVPSSSTILDKEDDENKMKTITATPVSSTESSLSSYYDFGISSLLPEWKKMFNKDTIFTDVSAGLTVGCVAVPLSLAIAVASGVPAEVGLVTAAVSGIAGGLMGGTTLAVTGPAAAISLLVVEAVHSHGLEALPFITLSCGALQVASGATRLGVVAKLVPVSVIAGFTTGIGTLILTGQLPKALGMTAPAGMNPVELLTFIGSNLSSIHMPSAALAIGTSAAMFMLPKLHPKIPSALLAVGGATLATHTMGLADSVSLIGQIPSGIEAFKLGFPIMPATESLPSLCATIGLIYTMTSVESLLSCTALEKMKKTDYKHNPDQELVGQGIANIGSSLFMGMPVTSVIARSSLNVRLNAETRLPALVQAGFVFSSVVFMSDQIAMIPMPALSGMLITTGMGMLYPAEFKHCYAVQKSDVLPFAVTVGGMLTMGLAEGIGVGCVSALALNYGSNRMTINETLTALPHHVLPTFSKSGKQMSTDKTNLLAHHDMKIADLTTVHADFRAVHTTATSSSSTNKGHQQMLHATRTPVYQVEGPINFIGMFEIDNLIKRIKAQKSSSPSPIILDMKKVTNVELTGIEELVMRLVEVSDVTGRSVQMINCSMSLENILDLVDPSQQIERVSTIPAAFAQKL